MNPIYIKLLHLFSLIGLISTTCVILKPRGKFAVPGTLCDNDSYALHVQPIYDLASDDSANASCSKEIRDKLEQEVKKLHAHIDIEEKNLTNYAKSICIGKAPMNCVPDELGYNRCACIDEGKGKNLQFVDDVDTCAVKAGGYCAPTFEDVLQCEEGTTCIANLCTRNNAAYLNSKILKAINVQRTILSFIFIMLWK